MLRSSFFAADTLEVAPRLLGAKLHVLSPGGELVGRIVETEAYLGEEDPASHAAAGPTPRSAIMFGPPGVVYVYLIYGIHHCLNIVTGPEETAGAVLIRALEPVQGQQVMARGRGLDPCRFRDRDLCSGPGKLCQALGIDRHWNGVRLNARGPRKIWLSPGTPPGSMVQTPRIGISKGQESAFRFIDSQYMGLPKNS